MQHIGLLGKILSCKINRNMTILYKKYYSIVFLLFCSIFLGANEATLEVLDIQEIRPNLESKTIDVVLVANKQGQNIQIDGANIEILEEQNGQVEKLEISNISKGYGKQQILFLIDAKSEITYHKKEIDIAIEQIIKNYQLPLSHIQQVEFQLISQMTNAVREMKSKGKGKVVTYLFTDKGGNFNDISINPEKYEIANKIRNDLKEIIRTCPSDFHLFPIALSNNVDKNYLETLTQVSPSTLDRMSSSQASASSLYDVIDNTLSDFLVSYVIQTNPVNPIYKGEKRNLIIRSKQDENISTSKIYGFGTPDYPIDLRKQNTGFNYYMNRLVIGALIVSILLALMSLLIPFFKKIAFRRKHIKSYFEVKPEGRIKRDPLTGEPFEDDEKVVVKCQHMMALSSWEYNKNQCVYYPDQCAEGVVNLGASKFFSQEGINKHLNWLWFGTLGGWIAWSLQAVLNNGEWTFLNVFSNYLASNELLASLWSKIEGANNVDLLANSLVEQLVMGWAMGIGLCFALAWVEERGQSSKLSWGSILLRTFIGSIIAVIVFFVGFFIAQIFQLPLYLGGLFCWVLFGICLGLVLSIRSNIETLRGILGGFVAGVIAFTLYFFISKIYPDFETLKMLSFILYGGVLGVIIVTILKRLEDFELEYLSPEKYRRINPISKWLKADMDIFIGSDAACYVFIKWNDPAVIAKHARLKFDKNVVYIEPLAETLLNGRNLPLHQKTPLRDGDIIKLGNESVTRMKFRAKSVVVSKRDTSQQAIDRPVPSIKIKKRAT